MGQEPEAVPSAEPVAETPAVTPDPSVSPDRDGKVFGEDYVRKLRDEAAGWRTKHQEAAQRLQSLEDEGKTEAQRLAERAEQATQGLQSVTQERDAALARVERFEVAAAAGLSLDWADRLKGDSREALEADAKALAERVSQSQPSPDWDSGGRPSVPSGLPDDASPALRLAHAYSQQKK